LLAGTSNSFAETGPSREIAQPLRLTVAPATSSTVAMKTLPEAICSLHAEGVRQVGKSLFLFADDDGMVRFYVVPSGESSQAAHFELDCDARGKLSIFPLDLRSSASPTEEMPAPVAETATSRKGASVRPALTNDEASHLSPEDLARRGYPLRPNPDQTSVSFRSWLRAVTQPSSFVSPRSVSHPEIRHSAPRSTTLTPSTCSPPAQPPCFQSGVDVSDFSHTSFDTVEGEWAVPTISGYEYDSGTSSTIWVGLWGSESSGLVRLWQAGTEQDAYDFAFPPFLEFRIASYLCFTDFPTSQFEVPEQVIPNFAVTAGDEIFTEIWIGNPGQSPSLPGNFAIVQMNNLTQREFTMLYVCRSLVWCTPSPTPFPGQVASWIIERPSVCPNGTNCAPRDLADYGQAAMGGVAHRTVDGFWTSFSSGAPFDMINNGVLLSSATCLYKLLWYELTCSLGNFVFGGPSNAHLQFNWHNFH
jgi:hypothetical protein